MNKTIILAAGHGGGDSGAVGQGTTEANETIQITNRVIGYLSKWGFPDIQKVPDELGLVDSINWVNARYKSVNGGLAIEIHKNSGGGTGIEVWFPSHGDATSKDQANKIANRMTETTGLRNRGIKDASTNRWGKLGWTDDTNTYALLIEAGFIDVDSNDDGADDRFAKGIALGIMDIFGLAVPADKVLATVDEVKVIYLEVLERAADPSGISTYANSRFTAAEVRQDLLNSDEYKQVQANKVRFNLVKGTDVSGKNFQVIRDTQLVNIPDLTRAGVAGKIDYATGEQLQFKDLLLYANSKGEQRSFYRTTYRAGRGEFIGFDANSLQEIVPPIVVEPPVVVPPTPTKDDEQDGRLSNIEKILKAITDFLSGLFTGFKK